MQQFQKQVDIEESVRLRAFDETPWSNDSGKVKPTEDCKTSKVKPTLDEASMDKSCQFSSPTDSNRSSSSSEGPARISSVHMQDLHHILSQLNYEELAVAHNHLSMDSASTGEFISLEHLDKLLLQNVRTEFYKFNT